MQGQQNEPVGWEVLMATIGPVPLDDFILTGSSTCHTTKGQGQEF
jgi:hypothetical protein